MLLARLEHDRLLIDLDYLKATVDTWNEAVEAGEDAQYGLASNLAPIGT